MGNRKFTPHPLKASRKRILRHGPAQVQAQAEEAAPAILANEVSSISKANLVRPYTERLRENEGATMKDPELLRYPTQGPISNPMRVAGREKPPYARLGLSRHPWQNENELYDMEGPESTEFGFGLYGVMAV